MMMITSKPCVCVCVCVDRHPNRLKKDDDEGGDDDDDSDDQRRQPPSVGDLLEVAYVLPVILRVR